jgi:NADPH2:quinone reductase
MRSAIYERKGKAEEVLRIASLAEPAPASGEVRVKVHASGVNPSDVKTRAGLSDPTMPYPYIVPHSDGAGVIDRVGSGVDSSLLGKRVWLFNGQWKRQHGTAAEFICLPASLTAALPDNTSFETGASLGVPLLTAYHSVVQCRPLSGKTVLVTGGAGAVGFYAIQLAKLDGARVISTVSSEEKARLAAAAGADVVINYRTEDTAQRVASMTDGQGVDHLIEVDAAANAADMASLLRFGGHVIVYGSGAPVIPVPFRPMITRFITLQFFIVYLLSPETLKQYVDGITDLLTTDKLKHHVVEAWPLQDIARAHQRVESGKAIGKIVLHP